MLIRPSINIVNLSICALSTRNTNTLRGSNIKRILSPICSAQCQRQFTTSLPYLRKQGGFRDYDDRPSSDEVSKYRQMDADKHQRYDRYHREPDDQPNKKKPSSGGFMAFMKRFSKNLFFITGAVVWGGLLVIYFFAEEADELLLHVRDAEEEVRLLAFYDVASFDNRKENTERDPKFNKEEIDSTYTKELALYKAIDFIKQQQNVEQRLGSPLQLTGYRVANKLNRMVQQYTQNKIIDIGQQKLWVAECLVEGPNGIASLNLQFNKESDKKDWVLTKATAHVLENSGECLFQVEGTMPDGVKI